MTRPAVAVVGSLVADLVVWLPRFPHPGETLPAERFQLAAGGKGFNQAVTAHRMGASVGLVGRVGEDSFGDLFFEVLSREAIDGRFVRRDPAGTSLGIPMIDAAGRNAIVGVPRANLCLAPEDVDAARHLLAAADVLLLQLEVPLATSCHAAALARASGALVVWNPAPATAPLAALVATGLVDWLVPNEMEAAALMGAAVTDVASAVAAGRRMLAAGVRRGVVVTLGDQGAVAVRPDGFWHAPAFAAESVDPTGAGDAFCGAFAVALAEGRALPEALRLGAAAGALCVTVAGAEPSLPGRDAVLRLAGLEDT
jgi:ribokinase